jgi:hypothetical protein
VNALPSLKYTERRSDLRPPIFGSHWATDRGKSPHERRATASLIASLAKLDARAAVADNIQLRCRAHNQYESERWFGAEEPLRVRERRELFRSQLAPALLRRFAHAATSNVTL